jgi:hypothetical protein
MKLQSVVDFCESRYVFNIILKYFEMDTFLLNVVLCVLAISWCWSGSPLRSSSTRYRRGSYCSYSILQLQTGSAVIRQCCESGSAFIWVSFSGSGSVLGIRIRIQQHGN